MPCRTIPEWGWEIHDRTLRRTLDGSRHLLRQPAAIAFDAGEYDRYRAEFDRLEVFNRETGDMFTTDASTFDRGRLSFDRGFGRQYALVLDKWFINGEP